MAETAPRILLADDEPSIVKVVGKLLERAGYEVLVARDGEEALQACRSEKLDAVVLDLMMPKRGGLEVCKILRLEEKTKTLPIIFYTGKGKEMGEETLREWKADGFVSKSEDGRVLLDKLEAVLTEKPSGEGP